MFNDARRRLMVLYVTLTKVNDKLPRSPNASLVRGVRKLMKSSKRTPNAVD